jgi:hypothetical protein
MTGLYSAAMRRAAVILFVFAIVIPIVSVVTAFTTYASLNGGEFGPYARGGVPSNLLPLLLAFVNGLNNAVWPFFGAALLWRWDKYVSAKGAAE